ncbi:MAG: Erythronate-4-phosphate dehydrogenase [Ignavibacteria bacterium]|nr:Erythronate-4-phosphate dehydrogenase [Ignavibacteria bacterium]
MLKNIIFVDKNISLLAESLAGCGEVNTFEGRLLNSEMLAEAHCDYLFVRSTTKVTKELLNGTNVKFVGTATSGTDHIDTDYLNSFGIIFADAAGSNANSVAEYVIYAILKWSETNSFNIKDKKIGIIGYGNIGKLVAKYSLKLGLQVFVNDPPLFESGFSFPDSLHYSDLEHIFQNCDLITNHVPLNFGGSHPTNKLINAQLISMLKNNALFIHTSRGGVVDEYALYELIQNKNIYLSIDVWENEPDFNTPLAGKSNIATPHIAGYSYDGKLKGALAMALAFERFSGEIPDYSIFNEELNKNKKLQDDSFRDSKLLYENLKLSRQIDRDTEDFLKLIDKFKEERKAGFDLLRKNYPKRREIL